MEKDKTRSCIKTFGTKAQATKMHKMQKSSKCKFCFNLQSASLGKDATKLGNKTFAAKLRRNKIKKSTRKRKDSEDP